MSFAVFLVFPSVDVEAREKDSKTHEFFDVRQKTWKIVIGGKNITVMKVNNVDWETLKKNIVFTDKYQQIPGTTIVKGVRNIYNLIFIFLI